MAALDFILLLLNMFLKVCLGILKKFPNVKVVALACTLFETSPFLLD
jgi:hypothetical protein